ncbi:MAG: hypothetical protein J6J38_13025 [Lachnospiraceae bacterium]|nr:hypothetical protein [Lachnospiraceae bacterium]
MKPYNNKVRKNLHKFFSCLALFGMLFCLSGCSKKTPREALEEAYQKTFVTGNKLDNLLGLTEIQTKLNENKAHSTGLSLTLQELSGMDLGPYSGFLSGLGITVDSASDLLNRKSAATIDITYGGTPYLTLGGQIQGSKIHVTVPQLLNGSLMVNLSTLKSDLNSDSMIARALRDAGVVLPEDLFSDLSETVLNPSTFLQLAELTAAFEELDEDIIVEKLKKKEVTLPEDITAKNIYLVTIPEDSYVKALQTATDVYMNYYTSLDEALGADAFSDLETEATETKQEIQTFGKELGDILLTVAVSKDGYIRYAESTATYEDETLAFTAFFSDGKQALEETGINFNVKSEETNINMNLETAFDPESQEISFSAKIKEDQEVILSLAAEGEFEDVVKGEKYALDFDYLEMQAEDGFSFTLAGDYYVDTTECNISAPSGAEYNLFTMTDSEFITLVTELLTNLQNDPLLSGLLGNFDFGMSLK